MMKWRNKIDTADLSSCMTTLALSSHARLYASLGIHAIFESNARFWPPKIIAAEDGGGTTSLVDKESTTFDSRL